MATPVGLNSSLYSNVLCVHSWFVFRDTLAVQSQAIGSGLRIYLTFMQYILPDSMQKIADGHLKVHRK